MYVYVLWLAYLYMQQIATATVAMAKEMALPPMKGENCTSEPHHVVNYCIKSCLSLSRGAA